MGVACSSAHTNRATGGAPGMHRRQTAWVEEGRQPRFQKRMTVRPLPSPRQAVMVCAFALLTALLCGGLLGAAALVPAPPAVLPLVIAVCIGCPMLAAPDVPVSVAVLRVATRGIRRKRQDPLEPWAVDEMLSKLEDLPETEHPLGL